MFFICCIIIAITLSLTSGSNVKIGERYQEYNTSILPSPRFQWNENRGYCGEVSTIIAAMSFGGFLSQYDLRSISVNYKESAQTAGEYLVGVNDQYTAKALRLKSSAWDSEAIIDSKTFLMWVKQQHLAGNIVTIGIYMNEYLFYGNTDPSAGDPVYDHIVTVYSIGTKFPNSMDYHADDTITISDHGLWNPHGQKSNATTAKYLFTYSFDNFQGNRRQANSQNGAIYTLPSARDIGNCGIAHTGLLLDNAPESGIVPVRVESSVNYEYPEIEKRSNDRPDPMTNIQLTIKVGPLVSNTKYILYRYDDEKMIPTSNFNSQHNLSAAHWDITIPDGTAENTYILTETVKSSDKAFYRCVLATAP